MKIKNRIKTTFNNLSEHPEIQPSNRPSVPSDSLNNLLAGKNVLITGAGQNIGRSIAIEMAKQQANIFFTDLNQKRIQKLEEELNHYPIRSQGFLSDISKTNDIDALLENLFQNDITINVLVNNAGIRVKEGSPLDLGNFHKTFNTNFFGPLYLTDRISRLMINNRVSGSVIFLTSIHQWNTIGTPSYSASKAALGMVVKELSLKLAPHNIRVNALAPGWIAEDEEGNTISHEYTPLHNSSINPCYVGRAAVYLTADYFSKFTTGTVLKIDAGLSLYSYRNEQPFIQ